MKTIAYACLALAAFFVFQLAHGTSMAMPGGPQLGAPGSGPVIDKSGDKMLQQMITSYVPRFVQEQYVDKDAGVTLAYNLFRPKPLSASERYPLVLFMADASTPGKDVLTPLLQGYGALVWATDQWQAQHPCFILVPQFSGVAVNDAYQRTSEVDAVIHLVEHLAATENIDRNRIYATGQSMGGMISMYYATAYPGLFAASLFVDCHWDTETFSKLSQATFTFITAGKDGKSFNNISALEKAADKIGRTCAFAEWSAKLPLAEQDGLANALFAEDAPINIINFTPKSVLPADGKGSEHMYSFDYAYRLKPVREWLFRQSR